MKIKVIGRFIQYEQVERLQQKTQQGNTAFFTTGKDRYLLVDIVTAEKKGGKHVPEPRNELERGFRFEKIEYALVAGEKLGTFLRKIAGKHAGAVFHAAGIVGINTGDVVMGNIGSKNRSKYAVVGRAVNLTARIESYTVGGQIFISENTLDECGRHLLRIDDEMEVMPKGVKKPITIYEVGGIRGEFNLFLPEKVDIELPDLPRPIPVLFTILEGKHAGDEAHSGTVVRMLDATAEIHADIAPDKLTNLKISVSDREGNEITTDLYAKVIGVVSDHADVFKVQFTSIPPEAEAFLKTVATQERAS